MSRALRTTQSFSNPSVASPTSQLILQSFFRFSYVTGSSLTWAGEPPMDNGDNLLVLKLYWSLKLSLEVREERAGMGSVPQYWQQWQLLVGVCEVAFKPDSTAICHIHTPCHVIQWRILKLHPSSQGKLCFMHMDRIRTWNFNHRAGIQSRGKYMQKSRRIYSPYTSAVNLRSSDWDCAI